MGARSRGSVGSAHKGQRVHKVSPDLKVSLVLKGPKGSVGLKGRLGQWA